MAKVIAHRGASKVCPQNTIPAFKKAVEMGADGFENDVHLTKDGRIVVCHNYNIDDTSTGSGYINDLTFDELRSYDFGSYFSPEFAGTKIPTLEEFLDVARDVELINIEIKGPRDGNLEIVKRTIDMVKDFGLFDRLLISSFDDNCLIACKEIDPLTQTGLLYSPDSPIIERIFDDQLGFAKNLRCDAVHPLFFYVDEEYVEESHKLGMKVNPWTTDTETIINAMLDFGCDGLITDYPDLARKIIAQR
ncbi:MAG: glycerophosphodiester phosphodiesterase [Clostridiales bacterium]|jgi:glycerophosphoryl diester phosphodiesterase|nr:glycerophosphodiester phosphodiesterase [Clostridiales bacterium]